MPIGSGTVYNINDVIISQVSSSGTAFLETKLAAATSSLIYFDSNAQINSASLSSITVGTASYFNGNSISSSYSSTSSYSIYAETSSNAQNAQDILLYVKNTSGAIISKGSIVRIKDLENSSYNPTIELADFRYESSSANTVGYTNEQFAINGFGYVITEGKLVGVDTSAFTSGDLLYLSSSGQYTNVVPIPPNHGVRVGQVIRSNNSNGSIYVTIDNGAELDELHNVIDTSTTSSHGDLLVKSGSVWKNNKNLTGSYFITGNLDITQNISASGTGSFGIVGIGTTSPSAKLEVQGSSSSVIQAIFQSAVGAAVAYNGGIQLGNASSNQNSQIYHSSVGDNTLTFVSNYSAGTGNKFIFAPGGTERVRFQQNGNVGIGTTSPSAKLEISSSNDQTVINAGGFNGRHVILPGRIIVGSVSTDYPRITYNAVPSSSASQWKYGQTDTAYSINMGNGNRLSFEYVGLGTSGSTFTTWNTWMTLVSGSNNVGIGVASPVNKLDVAGNISASAITASLFFGTSSWSNNSLTASYLVPTNSYQITNLTASNISASATGSFGIVGIGTTSPSYLLDVSGSSARINTSNNNGLILGSTKPISLFNYTSYGSNGSQLWAINQSGIGDAISLALGANFNYAKSVELTYNTSSGEFGIGSQGSSAGTHKSINLIVNNTSSVFITGSTSGYSSVGIGNTTPNSFVNSNVSYFSPNANSSFLTLYSKNAEASVNLVSSGSTNGASVGGIYFTREQGASDAHKQIAAIKAVQNGTSATLAGGKLFFYTKVSGGGTFEVNPQLTIVSSTNSDYSDANVGIGTSSPSYTLHVRNLSKSGSLGIDVDSALGVSNRDGVFTVRPDLVGNTGGFLFKTYNGASVNAVSITPTGNVGIGLTSPVNKLDVVGNISASVITASLFFGTSSWANNSLTASYLVPTNSYTITNLTASNISASGNGYFNNIGVGTTVITEKVNVSGNILLSNGSNRFVRIGSSTNYNYDLQTTGNDFQIIEAGTTPRLTIQYPNGNVGIGTINPSYTLDVSGSSRFGYTATNTHQFTGSVSLTDGLSAVNLTASNATINGNLTVTGSIFATLFSGSNIYITSSTLVVTDNILTLNALSPYQRYAGIEMYDSGSGNLSSFLWDGQGDYFFISGSGINGKIISGPDGQLNLTSGRITKATAGNILGDSIIYDLGNGIRVDGFVSASSFTSSVVNAIGFLGTSSWATNSSTASFLPVGTYNITSSWSTNSLTASSLVTTNSYTITNLTASNISASGTIRAVSLIETSTIAAKYNIVPLEDQLEKVTKLNPVSFIYKCNNEPSIGLIAEEVGEIYPEFTTTNKDAVAYSKMVSVLIQSVKELKSIVDVQQKQINELLKK